MRQLYYPTSQPQYFNIAAERSLLDESHNFIENATSAIGSIFRGFFFSILLGIGGVGILLCSWLIISDGGDL